MTSEERPLLAITVGDPAGIGPEVVVSALARRRARQVCRPLVIGDSRVLRRAAGFTGGRFAPVAVSDPVEAERWPRRVCLLDLANADPKTIPLGKVSAAAGQAAAEYIERAAELAIQGAVAGVVTAPVNKEALRLAGVRHAGHTEMLAALCRAPEVAMMLVGAGMRVSHATTHVPLREACRSITRARVLSVIRLTHQALKRMGISRPRIAVAGLNPHAGESAMFGDEEIREIGPAVQEARRQRLDAIGPLPPDTVFARHRAGEFDAVVAMAHDHGHIAVKTVGFAGPGGLKSSGVNVTLGLPIIRTSVDHGTAFDIAGKGVADPTSMVEAIRLAGQLARDSR
jgi:4-hydroxythreonine-4-phosphate dehydrogenase